MIPFALIEPRRLTYQGKQIRVCHISGLPRSIAVETEKDLQGFLYLSWWKPQAIFYGNRKRRRYKWRIQERHWKKFRNVFDLLRGIQQALESAQKDAIPTIEELQNLCQSIRVETQNLERITDIDAAKLKMELKKAHEVLRPKHSAALREAADQIKFCIPIRDSRGRLNKGVIQARLTAVDNRLLERLAKILAWLQNYAGWEILLRQLSENQRKATVFFEEVICGCKRRLGDPKGRNAAKLIAEISRPIGWLNNLRQIRGYGTWADNCRGDIIQINTALAKQQWDQALKITNRLLQSVRLKRFHFRLNRLSLEIGLDVINGQLSLERHAQAIVALQNELARIDERGFKTPICKDVIELLGAAKDYLVQDGDGVKQARAAIKRAMKCF